MLGHSLLAVFVFASVSSAAWSREPIKGGRLALRRRLRNGGRAALAKRSVTASPGNTAIVISTYTVCPSTYNGNDNNELQQATYSTGQTSAGYFLECNYLGQFHCRYDTNGQPLSTNGGGCGGASRTPANAPLVYTQCPNSVSSTVVSQGYYGAGTLQIGEIDLEPYGNTLSCRYGDPTVGAGTLSCLYDAGSGTLEYAGVLQGSNGATVPSTLAGAEAGCPTAVMDASSDQYLSPIN